MSRKFKWHQKKQTNTSQFLLSLRLLWIFQLTEKQEFKNDLAVQYPIIYNPDLTYWIFYTMQENSRAKPFLKSHFHCFTYDVKKNSWHFIIFILKMICKVDWWFAFYFILHEKNPNILFLIRVQKIISIVVVLWMVLSWWNLVWNSSLALLRNI